MIHVAILKPQYIDLILSGCKTVESRLSRDRRPPFGRIEPGDTIYFKQSGGPIRAAAFASTVWEFEGINTSQLAILRRRFERRVAAPSSFWRDRTHARYACFIELEQARPITTPIPAPRSFGSGWLILPDHAARRSA